MSKHFVQRRFVGPALAIAAALLFGASTPFAKEIGREVNPWLLAGLLYLGSGLGLTAWRLARNAAGVRTKEPTLSRADWPWLGAVVLFGGVAGPLLLMFGLRDTPAATASLLLNLEGLATMAIAWTIYRENVDARLLLGAFAILAGAVVLAWDASAIALSIGAVLIAGACLCWGIDNNLTRKLSAADPVQIATIKGFGAGATNVALGLASGAQLPSASALLSAGVLGFLGYGISLVLFVLALRELGAARTGAYFSTAPFIGAVVAVVAFGEPTTPILAVAAVLMGLGVWLHLTERHEHWHEHDRLTHDHAHVHDEHHQHAHAPGDPPGVPHTHMHTHELLRHKHPHFPDLHHRHDH